MNISGVLVRARPERFPEVIRALNEIDGAQIHTSEEDGGRIVLTVEDGPGYSVEESLLKVHLVDGISDAALVYQYSDEQTSATGSTITKELKA
jgi:nitrate reductase NapD